MVVKSRETPRAGLPRLSASVVYHRNDVSVPRCNDISAVPVIGGGGGGIRVGVTCHGVVRRKGGRKHFGVAEIARKL